MSEGLKAVMGGDANILVYREREHLHKVFSDQHSTHMFKFMTVFGAHQARTICPIRIQTV